MESWTDYIISIQYACIYIWGGFHKWGIPKMDGLYSGKHNKNEWFGGTPILRNLHIDIDMNMSMSMSLHIYIYEYISIDKYIIIHDKVASPHQEQQWHMCRHQIYTSMRFYARLCDYASSVMTDWFCSKNSRRWKHISRCWIFGADERFL